MQIVSTPIFTKYNKAIILKPSHLIVFLHQIQRDKKDCAIPISLNFFTPNITQCNEIILFSDSLNCFCTTYKQMLKRSFYFPPL